MSEREQTPLFILRPATRRTFLRGLGATAFGAVLGAPLAGCSGDGGSFVATGSAGGTGGAGSTVGLPATEMVAGSVDLSEITAQGLTVQSLYGQATPDGTGQFTVPMSMEGAQLLALTDGQGAVLGLSLGVPTVPARADGVSAQEALPRLLQFGGTATCAALLFLTPGILTPNPAEAARRMALILQLPTLQALRTELASQLRTRGLVAAVTSAGFQAALQACVEEYFGFAGSLREFDLFAFVAADLKHPEAPETRNPAELENNGWRFVSVVRQELTNLGQESVPHVPPALKNAASLPGFETGNRDNVRIQNLVEGKVPFGWGDLFTARANAANPTMATDLVDLANHPATAKVRYWFYGVGLNGGRTADLGNIQLDEFGSAPILGTTLFYFILPFLDTLGGFSEKMGSALSFSLFLVSGPLGQRLNFDAVTTAMRGDDPVAFASAYSNLMVTTFNNMVSTIDALNLGAIPEAGRWRRVLSFFGFLSSFLGAVNLFVAVNLWTLYPWLTYLDVDTEIGDFETQMLPALPLSEHPRINANGWVLSDTRDPENLEGTSFRLLVLKPDGTQVEAYSGLASGYDFNDDANLAYTAAEELGETMRVQFGPTLPSSVVSQLSGPEGRLLGLPAGVNNRFDVAGLLLAPPNSSHPHQGIFVYRPAPETFITVDLISRLGAGSMAVDRGGLGTCLALNDLGHVAGIWMSGSGPFTYTLFLYRPEEPEPVLVVLTETSAVLEGPVALNNVGQIVFHRLDAQNFPHAQVWKQGTVEDLPPQTSYRSSHARAINDLGWVVGASHAGPQTDELHSPWRATLWKTAESRQPVDLASDLPPATAIGGARVVGSVATDVSSSGWITGITPVNAAGQQPGVDPPAHQVFRLKPLA